jgi:hypothetical protein
MAAIAEIPKWERIHLKSASAFFSGTMLYGDFRRMAGYSIASQAAKAGK